MNNLLILCFLFLVSFALKAQNAEEVKPLEVNSEVEIVKKILKPDENVLNSLEEEVNKPSAAEVDDEIKELDQATQKNAESEANGDSIETHIENPVESKQVPIGEMEPKLEDKVNNPELSKDGQMDPNATDQEPVDEGSQNQVKETKAKPLVFKAKEVIDENNKKKYEYVSAPLFDIGGSWKRSFLGFGFLSENYGKIQDNENGQLNGLDFWPYVKAGIKIGDWKQFSLLPEAGISFFNEAEDSSINRLFYYFKFDIMYSYNQWLNIKIGSSLLFNQYRPNKKGTVQLVNGTNPNSDFYLPNRTETSINNTFDLALETFVDERFSLQIQTMFISLFDSQRRSVSYLFSVSYYFDRKVSND